MTELAGAAAPAAALWPPLLLAQVQSAGPGTTVGSWAARFAVYLTLTLVVGGLLTDSWLLPADPRGTLSREALRATRLAARAGLAWAVAALALFVFGLSNAAARPVPDVLRWELVSPFLTNRFGAVVLLTAVVAFLVSGLAAAANTLAGARVALVGAALGALGPALWGHAGGAGPFAVVADALHVMGAASWMGGLAALVTLVLREDVEPLAPSQRFSDLALVAFAVVGASGVATAWLHLGEARNLLDTTWGRLVLVKVALFAVIGVLAWLNRRRRLPALTTGGDTARRAFRVLAGVEVVAMVAALAVAATLASSVPADVEAAERVQTLRTSFGDGSVDLSIDPAATGDNVVHVYWFDAEGRAMPVQNPDVTLTSGDVVVDVPLFVAGPGHDTAPSVTIPEAGTYTVTITGTVAGRREQATGSVTIR